MHAEKPCTTSNTHHGRQFIQKTFKGHNCFKTSTHFNGPEVEHSINSNVRGAEAVGFLEFELFTPGIKDKYLFTSLSLL